MKLQEIREIANDTGVHAERGYQLKNFANRIVELDRQQRPWVGLEKSDMPNGADPLFDDPKFIAGMVYAANKLMEKNT